MIVGQYRSAVVDLGPNVSRILEADLVYVKDIINIKTGSSVAPVLYGFTQRPQLDQERHLFYDLKYNLLSSDYQNWKLWLNNGSKVELKYDIYSTHIFYILLVVLRGQETLLDWTSDPLNPRLAASWHYVHGSGVINFEAAKDGEYYFTLGNLNDYSVEVRLQTTVHAKVYDTKAADLSCSLRENFCGLNLLFPGFNFALLSTPPDLEKGAEWKVQMVYGQRWIIYLILIGFVLSMAFLSLKVTDKICTMISMHDEPIEQATIVAPIDNPREPLLSAREDTSTPNDFEVNETMSENGKKIYESQFCAICCNETRSTFFHPCGHCVTCYACGLRIQNGESEANDLPGKCPICRSEIKEVKKIFTV
ncbi:hypothetical protein O6H91_01G018200 [Diphasiastrum complanatum]|nr:hypothetical protein O6H91_01G018200 [Diphasiastrum complanatum]